MRTLITRVRKLIVQLGLRHIAVKSLSIAMRNSVVIMTAAGLGLLLYYVVTSDWQWPTSCERQLEIVEHRLRQQLNEISLTANQLQENYQQLICDTKKNDGTSSTGGWCSSAVRTGHVTDNSLAGGMAVVLSGSRVVGLGDGIGAYRRLLLDGKKLQQYDAFDGAPYIKQFTNGSVGFIDLTLPQYWLSDRRYDWVVCLEVIEHIPAQYEDVVLDNIARAATHGVIMSWATVGQGGFHHVNNRPDDHVIGVMRQRGFERDNVSSTKLRSTATAAWLIQNVYVYRRVSASIELFVDRSMN